MVPFDLGVHVIPVRYEGESRFIEDAHEHHDIRCLLITHGEKQIHASD